MPNSGNILQLAYYIPSEIGRNSKERENIQQAITDVVCALCLEVLVSGYHGNRLQSHQHYNVYRSKIRVLFVSIIY